MYFLKKIDITLSNESQVIFTLQVCGQVKIPEWRFKGV